MHLTSFAFSCAAALLATLAPAAADDVIVMKNHTDEFSMMGQKTPASDEKHEYWFGDKGTRFDSVRPMRERSDGETRFIT